MIDLGYFNGQVCYHFSHSDLITEEEIYNLFNLGNFKNPTSPGLVSSVVFMATALAHMSQINVSRHLFGVARVPEKSKHIGY